MLLAKNIRLKYDDRVILDDVSFSINHGERVVLTGSNGAGKSTMGLLLAGLIEPDSGTIEYNNKILYSDEEEIRHVGIMLQNPENSLLTTQVARELAYPLEFLSLNRNHIIDKIDESIHDFGLEKYINHAPSELSGGLKSRLALAVSVVTEPPFLVLDEPTSWLDHEGKVKFFKKLKKLAQKGTGIILITQNKDFSLWGDKHYHLDNGTLHTNTNIISKKYPSVIEPQIKENVISSLKNISFNYEQYNVFENLNLEIHQGESIALLGASGAGKTTLLHLITKLYKPDKGKVNTEGSIGVIFQNPEMQLFDETVIEDVCFGPKNMKLKNHIEIAQESLERMNIPKHLWQRLPHSLSEGEKRRVGIAGVLAMQPELLALDEPSSSLDIHGRILLLEIINSHLEKSGTVITISHNLEFIEKFCSRAIVLKDKRIAFDGKLTELIENKELLKLYGLGYDKDVV